MALHDRDFPADPYPGARPTCSFVHEGGVGRVLPADPDRPWQWTELAGWPADRGAEPLAGRVPVLAYGSNVNPAKITWLRDTYGLTGPVVVVRVRCTGLAAVWAAGLRARDGQRPATLAAEPGRVEWHAVWLATRDQVRALDRCEGRGTRYRLVRLASGTVTAEDGTDLGGVFAYTGAGQRRAPLLVAGRPVRCADVPQSAAVGLVGLPGPDGLVVRPVPAEPDADDWPDRVFVYGTLRPDGPAWHRVRSHVDGPPTEASVSGALYDTDFGYPALTSGNDTVPGWALHLRSPAEVLAELDAFEGSAYRRVRVVDSGGRLCWTYLWTEPTDGFVRLSAGWPG